MLQLLLLTLSFATTAVATAQEVRLKSGYNLRQKPGTESRRLGVTSGETRARVISQTRHWALVEINGQRSFISTKAFAGRVFPTLPESGPTPTFRPDSAPVTTPVEEAPAGSVAEAVPEMTAELPVPEEATPAASTQTENSFWKEVPARNWAKVNTRSLNMRASPSTQAAVRGQIRAGARVAVIETQERDGRRWHRVLPFDCSENFLRSQSEKPCGEPVWIAGDYLAKADVPAESEMTAAADIEGVETEASACFDCESALPTPPVAGDQLQNLGDIAAAVAAPLPIPRPENSEDLYSQYLQFHKSYLGKYPPGRNKRAWARENKTRFLTSLITTFGVEKAGKMIMALTAFGEARGESPRNEWQNITEMAFVSQIIKNRAAGGFRDDRFGEPLRVRLRLNNAQNEVDLWEAKGAPIRVALAESQFSTWNTNDNNLSSVMTTGPSLALERAFRSVKYLDEGQIKPLGELAKPSADHYHASWMTAWWARRMKRINPQMETPVGVLAIRSHRAYR